jgi:peroxiredoxin
MLNKKYPWSVIFALSIIILMFFLIAGIETVTASGAKSQKLNHKTGGLFRDAGVREISRITLPEDISLLDLNGKKVSVADLKGRIVFIYFWSTWNADCRVEMPSMEKLYKRFKNKDFFMAAVNLNESVSRIKKFFNGHRLTFTALLDSEGKIGERFGINKVPLTFILDKDGRVIGKANGIRNWNSKQATALFEYLVNETI